MELKVLAFLLLAELVRSQTTSTDQAPAKITDFDVPPCASFKSCDECLADDNCLWKRDKLCSSTCPNFPNINCYYPRMFGPPTMDRREICQVSQHLLSDNEQCFSHSDPVSCHAEMGCYWLTGMTDADESASWCVLHLASTKESITDLTVTRSNMNSEEHLSHSSSGHERDILTSVVVGFSMMCLAAQ